MPILIDVIRYRGIIITVPNVTKREKKIEFLFIKIYRNHQIKGEKKYRETKHRKTSSRCSHKRAAFGTCSARLFHMIVEKSLASFAFSIGLH